MTNERIAELAYQCGFEPFNGTQLYGSDAPGLIFNYESDVSEQMYKFADLIVAQCDSEAMQALRDLHERFLECFGTLATAEDAYDSFYQDIVRSALRLRPRAATEPPAALRED